MLMAASVTINGRGYAGDCIRKQWLIRRLVRSPASSRTTAAINSSVCRLPFISASALPCVTSSTARVAAALLCGTSSISMPLRSRPASAATRISLAYGATRHGTIRPSACASITADRLSASHGWTTAMRIAPRGRTWSSSRWMPSLPVVMRTSGSVVRGRSILSVGAMTSASPAMATVPLSFVQVHASLIRFLSSSLLTTVTRMVSVSPTRTGARNCSVCPR